MSIRTSTLVFSLAMIVLASASACDVDRDSQADPAASEAYFGPAGQVEVASNGSPSSSVSATATAAPATMMSASTRPSQNRGRTASPSVSVTTSAPSATGDFTFTVHGCSWFPQGGNLFIRPIVDVVWSGSGAYPKHTVSATSDVGQVKNSLQFAAAGTFFILGGSPVAGNVWLGKVVKITIVADAASVVPELNETNNVRVLTIAVPSSAPTSDQALSCS